MPASGPDFFQRFSDTFLSDDIDGFMTLIDPDCTWEIMATGETFSGAGKVRELAERSVAARTHTDEAHMKFVNHIVTDDQMCLEYVHEGIITSQLVDVAGGEVAQAVVEQPHDQPRDRGQGPPLVLTPAPGG